jgi:hypothetical protein
MTIRRDLYDAVEAGAIDHRPSDSSGAVFLYAVAVPEKKNSDSRYPAGMAVSAACTSNPDPPVTGPVPVGEAADGGRRVLADHGRPGEGLLASAIEAPPIAIKTDAAKAERAIVATAVRAVIRGRALT